MLGVLLFACLLMLTLLHIVRHLQWVTTYRTRYPKLLRAHPTILPLPLSVLPILHVSMHLHLLRLLILVQTLVGIRTCPATQPIACTSLHSG